MGLPKEYRNGLKYRVASAKCKTLESLLAVKFRDELGMSETESRLLGDSIGKWILSGPDLRGPNQIIFEDSKGSKMRMCFKGKPDFDLMNLAKAFLEKNL